MSGDRNELVEALKLRIDDLALTLLGEPNCQLSNRTCWRYGHNGSLAIEVGGNQRGVWYSHEDGIGGAPIELIMRERGLDMAGAFQFAREWLGGSFLQAGDSRSSRRGHRAPVISSPKALETEPERAAEPESRKDPAAYAKEILAGSAPVARTIGEAYLRLHRGITGPLPEQLRVTHSLWHREAKRAFPALLVPAFDSDGELRRVQAIYLDPESADKASLPPGCNVKLTFGKGASHIPAAFLGKKPGERWDVFLLEGPEDGLALYSVLADEGGDVAPVLGKSNLRTPFITAGIVTLTWIGRSTSSHGRSKLT